MDYPAEKIRHEEMRKSWFSQGVGHVKLAKSEPPYEVQRKCGRAIKKAKEYRVTVSGGQPTLAD